MENQAFTHKPIVDYFESLNENLIDFNENSFFRMDLDELFGAFRSGITFPCMTTESPEGDAGDSTLSNSVIGRFWAFTIYQNPERGNAQQLNQMLDECEQIGLKIVSRMRLDARNPEHLLYNKFKVASVKWVKVGPVFTENLYGYRFSGEFKDNEALTVKAEDWIDLDTVC